VRKQAVVNFIERAVGVILLILLYMRITNYYQLTRRRVTTYSMGLHFYIVSLWILSVLVVAIMVLFFFYGNRSYSAKHIMLAGALLIVGLGVVFQFINQPDYTKNHVTPIPISATKAVQEIQKKRYSSYDTEIYFYNSDSKHYPKVRKEIRRYSLSAQEDFYSIDLKNIRTKLGSKKYLAFIKKTGIKSQNVMVITYREDGHNKIKTFNKLENRHALLQFVNYISDNVEMTYF